MKNWKDFETLNVNYLKDNLINLNVDIEKMGDADSTRPDIQIVLKNNLKKFFIETKMPSSQTSQFVVEIENNRFIYGKKNKFESNEFSEEIIDLLNENFKYYKNVGQSGLEVPVPILIAFGWIISNMKNKNVEFIMSVDNHNNNVIIPVEKFNEFFNVKTILRRKKSGSTPIPKIYYNDFKTNLEKNFIDYNPIIFIQGNRLYIKLNKELSKNECYIKSDLLENKRYYLSNTGDNVYEIKLTSATNNPNIIFELSAKSANIDSFTLQTLIDYINEEDS
mgnify:FL=1